MAGSIVLAERQRSAGDMQGSHLATYPAACVCGWGRALLQQGRGKEKREGAERARFLSPGRPRGRRSAPGACPFSSFSQVTTAPGA